MEQGRPDPSPPSPLPRRLPDLDDLVLARVGSIRVRLEIEDDYDVWSGREKLPLVILNRLLGLVGVDLILGERFPPPVR